MSADSQLGLILFLWVGRGRCGLASKNRLTDNHGIGTYSSLQSGKPLGFMYADLRRLGNVPQFV
ncbi:MAG: hypothetical protein ABI557_03065 [Aureliella sp.]